MKPKSIVAGIAGAILIIVLFQNMQIVSLRFLFWQLSISRILLIPLILIVGGIIGFIIGRKSWDW